MFADRAKIIIRSGKGGDGHVSFRRELYVPNGGPDGGDGGRGGDVIFEVDEGQNTLGEYRHKHKFKAQDGQEGGKKRCHGADGDDIVLKVPEGTVIMEAQSRKVIADMSGENVFNVKNFTQKVALVIGNEGNGVSENLRKICTKVVSIPMQNNVESLNASVSAGIIMYQIKNNQGE